MPYGVIELGQYWFRLMACYLNQCWLIIRKVLIHSHECSFRGNAQDIYSCYDFDENYSFRDSAPSPRGQYVKHTSRYFTVGCIIGHLKSRGDLIIYLLVYWKKKSCHIAGIYCCTVWKSAPQILTECILLQNNQRQFEAFSLNTEETFIKKNNRCPTLRTICTEEIPP